MDRVLEGAALTPREAAFRQLVAASHLHVEDERRALVRAAATVLTVEEVYHASSVIALFNFYNKFVDVNGVADLAPDVYERQAVRLATNGYAPPAGSPTASPSAPPARPR
ncbi:MAG TPA: hypothetical protein VG916_08370 [Gemmatimonadaceae bacterium]|nr:hypothetical protein [Gemmatimonadaceae bacterium]